MIFCLLLWQAADQMITHKSYGALYSVSVLQILKPAGKNRIYHRYSALSVDPRVGISWSASETDD